MAAENLKPCPFCGGDAEVEDWECGYEEGTTIQCQRCGAYISEGNTTCNCGFWHAIAVRKWNTRKFEV